MLIVPSCTYSVAAFNFWLFLANMETDLYWCLIVKCICFQHTSFPWFTANQSVSWWWWKHGSKPFQLVSAFKSWVRRIFFLLALGCIIWLSKGIGDCWYCWIKVATCQKWCARKKKWLWGVCSQSPSQLFFRMTCNTPECCVTSQRRAWKETVILPVLASFLHSFVALKYFLFCLLKIELNGSLMNRVMICCKTCSACLSDRLCAQNISA